MTPMADGSLNRPAAGAALQSPFGHCVKASSLWALWSTYAIIALRSVCTQGLADQLFEKGCNSAVFQQSIASQLSLSCQDYFVQLKRSFSML